MQYRMSRMSRVVSGMVGLGGDVRMVGLYWGWGDGPTDFGGLVGRERGEEVWYD